MERGCDALIALRKALSRRRGRRHPEALPIGGCVEMGSFGIEFEFESASVRRVFL